MNRDSIARLSFTSLVLVASVLSQQLGHAQDSPLRVFATTPDLGSLAREVGGEHVQVTVMVKGPEDAHFSEAKPSFIKELNRADVYVQVGLELEVGYAPLLLQNARNRRVLPGSPGYIDASTAIAPLEVPSGPVDRSMGDVHPFGSPHYLLDPVRGVRVAELLAQRFAQLRPQWRDQFRQRLADLRQRVDEALVGATLAAKYNAFQLAELAERGRLASFLAVQEQLDELGGWLGLTAPLYGTPVVDDHRMWAYFAQRFGFRIFGHLEPIPGVPPTTKHLTELVDRMKAENVEVVIAAPYYDPRHARFIASASGAVVVPLAHQTGGREGAETYLKMIDYNVRQLVEAVQRVKSER